MILSGLLAGCSGSDPTDLDHRQASEHAGANQDTANRSDQESGDAERQQRNLSVIRRLISSGDRQSALEQLQAHLLQHPDDATAMILAAPLLQADRRIDEAVAMFDAAAGLVPEDSAKWSRRAAQLLDQEGRWEESIDRLQRLVERHSDATEIRHDLIAVLNRRGFRYDANEHVRLLCHSGQATADELRGLIYPTRSFHGLSEAPNVENVEANHVLGELNVALAMYGEGEIQNASAVLQTSRLIEQRHPAAVAFYGQLLIESQQFDDFQRWLDRVEPNAQLYPTYWMAQGTWALRQRQTDAAIGCFLQALLKEPGDLAAIDRISQCFAASGRTLEQDRFRQRGVMIDRMMTVTREWFAGGARNPAAIDELARLLDEVGRPLEALAWYRVALLERGSPGGTQNQKTVGSSALERIEQAIALAEDETLQADSLSKQLCGLDQDRFPAQPLSGMGETNSHPDARTSAEGSGDTAGLKSAIADWIAPIFVNVAGQVGLNFTYYNSEQQIKRHFRLFEQLGAGVACLDYDLDGRIDFYLGQASGNPAEKSAENSVDDPRVASSLYGTQPNVLARSLGDQFVTVTAAAGCDDRGYTFGVTAGDWNQDGFPDLVVGNLGVNSLWINHGDGTFSVQPGDSEWSRALTTASVAMADVNGDHLPDIIEINYVDDPNLYDPIVYKPDGSPVRLPAPMDFRPAPDRVFYSVGDGRLAGQWLGSTDRSTAATGLGVIVTDLVAGASNEIYIANDRLPNQLWERPLQFESPDPGQVEDRGVERQIDWDNTSAARGIAYGSTGAPQGSMGIAVADFDHNGRLDLHVTNFEGEWNNQFMQDQSGYFEDRVVASGLDRLTYPLLGFGTQALDYDNNGETDLVIANGHVEDYSMMGKQFEMPTILLTPIDSQFVSQSVAGDASYWDHGHLSRAVARCDWNADGRMDFVVTDLLQPFALLENRTQSPCHFLQLQLVGTSAERDAVGAAVTITIGDRNLTQAVQSGDGYMCRNQAILGFGIGDDKSVDAVTIRWPDGHLQSFGQLAADRCWLVVQGQGQPYELHNSN